MRSDIVIEIFGTPTDSETFGKVLDAAFLEGATLDWEADAADVELAESALQAADENGMLRLMKSDTNSEFNDIREACKLAGASYIFSSGPSGGEGYDTASYWKPGMDTEFTATLDGINPVLNAREVREAALEGIEAVNALLAHHDRMTLAYVSKKLVLSEDIRAELEASLPTP